MEERREESLVHVQRLSNSKNPLKHRRCGEDSEWYNFGKPKDVRNYRFHPKRKANPLKCLKIPQQEKAILSDVDFQVQEQDEELQTSDSDYSDSDAEESTSDGMARLSAGVQRKKLKLLRELKTHKGHKIFIPELSSDTKFLDIYASLVDAQVSVNSRHKQENIPFVHLTSQLRGQPIVGYPLEVEVLKDDVFKTLCSKRGSDFSESSDIRGVVIDFDRLVWKTGKRTPVYYVVRGREIGGGSTMPTGRKGKKLGKGKQASGGSCVCVELIFRKLLAAVV